ncbi:MAG: DUF1800 domain-containing protein [Bacteroidetes Order II. Incertae sedis bacterium]|nr:DUF1800 domain-containing protein [Bacteroidetes Order II. bacterium]
MNNFDNHPISSTPKQGAPMPTAPVVAGGLEPYVPTSTMPWNRERVMHLLRRTGFGAPYNEVSSFLNRTPLEAINQIINNALNLPLPTTPSWATTGYPASTATQAEKDLYNTNARNWLYEYQNTWYKEMRGGALREKLTLFWSNHFVTAYGSYNNNGPFGYQYIDLLRRYALGNFSQLVREVGKLPAMLYYLNGRDNRKGAPNENYARELLELFTMGIGNYTQEDIVQTAKALTGWQVNTQTLSSFFNSTRFETGNKTIFGKTGAWGYDDVINLIFSERKTETARFVCWKLYQFFVYFIPNETIVTQLADQLIAHNFEITPILRTLFASTHFFESVFIGAKYKSPVELTVGLFNEVGLPAFTEANYTSIVRTYLNRADQMLMSPPNVAGWPEYRSWISTNALTRRWDLLNILALGTKTIPALPVKNFALGLPNVGNAYELAFELANRIVSVPFPETEKTALGKKLLDGMPDYEWSINASTAESKLKNFLRYLVRLPEFQLC